MATVSRPTGPAPVHPGSFLLGSAREVLANQVRFFESTYSPGRDVVRVRFGPPGARQTVHVLHSPDGAEQALAASTCSNFLKEHPFYDEIRLALGNGILTAQGEDWLRQRRFIQPIFTRGRVDGYLTYMLAEIDAVAASWRSGAQQVDLGQAMTGMTLRIVGQALFGDDVTALESAVNRHFATVNSGLLTRATFPWRVPLTWPLPVNTRTRTARDGLYQACDAIIADRRATDSVGDDLASLLIDACDGADRLDDEEVRDQILIFLLAGHETTSTSLTFTLHLLARHPELQERVRDEVVRVVGEGAPSPAQVHGELPWTTAVLKEAMRLYPAAPFIGRRTIEAVDVAGSHLPAGSNVVLSVWTIHRRADLWPEPLRFDPTRFLPGQDAGRPRYAWLPFGAGPRACIGQHFSMLESVATLALLVREFEFSAPEGSTDQLPVASGITLFPLEPVTALVTPR